jgi:hypothetical protein
MIIAWIESISEKKLIAVLDKEGAGKKRSYDHDDWQPSGWRTSSSASHSMRAVRPAKYSFYNNQRMPKQELTRKKTSALSKLAK